MASRYEGNRRRGIRDESVSGSGRMKDMLAAEGEAWYARAVGATLPRDRGRADPGWDFVHRGWHVDVKWAEHARDGLHQMPWHSKPGGKGNCPRLIVSAWKPLRAHIYALVIGYDDDERDKYWWANGWAFRAEVERAENLAQGGTRRSSGQGAPYYQIEFDRLRPIEELASIEERT